MSVRRIVAIGGVLCLVCIASTSAKGRPTKKPQGKNVILLIGDGMGPRQVQAAREMAGGELALDNLEFFQALVTTHNIDEGVTDSAAAGTALATGFKTKNGNISMAADDVTPLPTSMELARDKGMATGIVTNTYVQDATPGVWMAHAPSRDGRSIALQQRYAGMDVLLGAGRYYMLSEPPGSRSDGRNLIEEMVADGYTFVDTLDELNDVRSPRVGLLGIFGSIWTTEYVLDRDNDQNAPTLVEMAAKAIDILDGRSRNGFFLVIEGAFIDWMGHNRGIAGVVAEALEFDKVVQLALNFAADDGNTLVVATADHETGGLDFIDGTIDVDFLSGVTCTGSFMWGLIHKGEMSNEEITSVLHECGIKDLSEEELGMIEDCGGRGISNVLSERAGVEWENSGCKGGNHTITQVEVRAYGPGAEQFGDVDVTDNTHIGQLLFDAVNR